MNLILNPVPEKLQENAGTPEKINLAGGAGSKSRTFWWGRLRIPELALLVGVTTKNWSKTFTGHWVAMKHIFHRLDSEALLLVEGTRSKQKAAFS